MSEPQRNTSIPIEPEIVRRIRTHLADGTTDKREADRLVPAEHFLSPSRAAAEIKLMKTLPLIVAHRSELKEPGDFITREVLGVPLIITRRSDGEVAAYLNMCRHRGGVVEGEASGRKRVFTCRYHGWSYERDSGDLRSAPHEDFYDPLDRRCNALIAFRVEERHGLIFLTLSQNPQQNVADYLGARVDAIIEPWNLPGSAIFLDKTYDLDANWKLVVDGAIDSLHVAFLHANSFADMIADGSWVFEDLGRHGRLCTPRRRLQEMVKAGETAGDDTRFIATDMLIYPNSLMIGSPDHVEFWTVWPRVGAPDKSTINIRFFVRPEILTAKMEERIRRSWAILENAALTEDWPMEVSMQKNIAANPTAVFRYGRGEVSAGHLHAQLSRDLDESGR